MYANHSSAATAQPTNVTDLHAWANDKGRDIPSLSLRLRLRTMNIQSQGMEQGQQAPLPAPARPFGSLLRTSR